MNEPVDLDAIARRWHTYHDRSADDYTDAGCRVLAEHAFRDAPALIAELRQLRSTLNGGYDFGTEPRPTDAITRCLDGQDDTFTADAQRTAEYLLHVEGQLRQLREENAKNALKVERYDRVMGLFEHALFAAGIGEMQEWYKDAREAKK